MKKCDFHIHTIKTIRDADFNYDSDRFKEYLDESNLDCVAITNHNIFDKSQFDLLVQKNPNKTIYPGIEINVRTGHIIILAEPSIVDEFERKVSKYSRLNDDLSSFEEATSILNDFSGDNYIIIPHYNKKDQLSDTELKKYGNNIFVGEVSNAAKFYRMKNDKEERLTPLLSSDYRIKNDGYINTANFTYIDVPNTNFKKIRNGLLNKRVYIAQDKIDLIYDKDLNIKYHPNLNVLIGGRSSGKTFLLNRLFEKNKGISVKYIQQFSLLEDLNLNEDKKQTEFERQLKKDFSYKIDSYRESFSEAVSRIIKIDPEEMEKTFNDYCDSVVKFAKESFAHNTFAKHPIFNSINLEVIKINHLENLISATFSILYDKTYANLLDKFNIRNGLELYLRELCSIIIKNKKENDIIKYTNETLSGIKNDFSVQAMIEPIIDFSVLNYFENLSKIQKFNKVCELYVRDEQLLSEKIGNKFEIVATKTIPKDAKDFTVLNGNKQGRYKEGVDLLLNGEYFDFIQWCKKNEKISDLDIHKLFVKIEFVLLNEYKLPVSGGERAEYNLLKELEDAKISDLLLIDEPESSFGNIFLKDFFNEEIKKISRERPVIVATHNSTIGASLNPDFYLYTERNIINNEPKFSTYYGQTGASSFVTGDKSAKKSFTLIIDQLEAGEKEYIERKDYYEKFKD